MPRDYDEILREEEPDLYEEVKRTRREWLKAHEEDLTPRRLEDKHICAKARVKENKREL